MRIHVLKSPIFVHWLEKEPENVARVYITVMWQKLGDMNLTFGLLFTTAFPSCPLPSQKKETTKNNPQNKPQNNPTNLNNQ